MRTLLLVLAVLAVPSLVRADSDGDSAPQPPRRNKFVFPEDKKAAAPTAGTDQQAPVRPGADAADPEDPTTVAIRQEIAALATWQDRPAVHAAESLLLRGLAVVPFLVETLSGKESTVQPGAAWVLGKLGEPAHVVVILRAAAERSNGSRAEEFFEAAYGLDPARTKEWLFSFIAVMGRPVFRDKSTVFLAGKAAPEDRERVLKLLAAPKPEVRIAGLRLLVPVGVPDANARLEAALSDVSPEVAKEAGRVLAPRADEAAIARLNALARDGQARERAYATLALVEVVRIAQKNAFEPATLAELAGRRGLLHPEKLSRGTAAIGLAFGALGTTDPSLAALLDGPVVEVLIDAVGGEHFRDYASVVSSAFAALRRLSGRDLPETATEWAKWWQGERGKFRARRPLHGVAEEDTAQAYVRFEVVERNGRRRRATYVSDDAPARADSLLLARPAFRALLDVLQEQGVFETQDSGRPSSEEHVAVAVGLTNQEKRLVVAATDPRHAVLRMRADSLEEANDWQRYRDADKFPDARGWWQTNAPLLAAADPDTRRALMQAMVVEAFDDLTDDAARSEALDRIEDPDAPLSAAQTRSLALAAAGAKTFGSTEGRALRIALAQPRAAEVAPDVVEALAARTEPEAGAILADLLARGGAAGVRAAFADPRPPVRQAAARAATELFDAADATTRPALAETLKPGLEVLSKDTDRAVAIRALLGLAQTGDVGAVPALEAIYTTGTLPVKIAVAESLGSVPGDAAHPLLALMLAEERATGSGALRAAALRSIARTKHPNAVGMLGHYMLNDVDPDVQQAAADALVELGTDDARFFLLDLLTRSKQPDPVRRARLVDALGRFRGAGASEALRPYLEDPDVRVSARAALRLAEQNDAAAVPYLIRLLRSGRDAERDEAAAVLADVTSVSFEVVGSADLAERYERWYAEARGGTDRTWFRDALKRKGYDIGPLGPYAEGEGDPSAVPVLVRALRDDDPAIRRNAEIALERITGRSFGHVERGTSARDAARIADQWHRWWESVSGRK